MDVKYIFYIRNPIYYIRNMQNYYIQNWCVLSELIETNTLEGNLLDFDYKCGDSQIQNTPKGN